MAVAFLKLSGFKLIEKDIKIALKKGSKINIIVGLDFGFSEPSALHSLLDLFENNKNAHLYFAQGKSGGVFHPKFYLFKNRKTAKYCNWLFKFYKRWFY